MSVITDMATGFEKLVAGKVARLNSGIGLGGYTLTRHPTYYHPVTKEYYGFAHQYPNTMAIVNFSTAATLTTITAPAHNPGPIWIGDFAYYAEGIDTTLYIKKVNLLTGTVSTLYTRALGAGYYIGLGNINYDYYPGSYLVFVLSGTHILTRSLTYGVIRVDSSDDSWLSLSGMNVPTTSPRMSVTCDDSSVHFGYYSRTLSDTYTEERLWDGSHVGNSWTGGGTRTYAPGMFYYIGGDIGSEFPRILTKIGGDSWTLETTRYIRWAYIYSPETAPHYLLSCSTAAGGSDIVEIKKLASGGTVTTLEQIDSATLGDYDTPLAQTVVGQHGHVFVRWGLWADEEYPFVEANGINKGVAVTMPTREVT